MAPPRNGMPTNTESGEIGIVFPSSLRQAVCVTKFDQSECAISSFSVHKHQSGEVSLVKILSLTKSVIFFFPVEIRFKVRGTNWLSGG